MKAEAIIFDKDGTLIDFDAFWVSVSVKAIEDVLHQTGLQEVPVTAILEAFGVHDGVTDINGVLCKGTYEEMGHIVHGILAAHGCTLTRDEVVKFLSEELPEVLVAELQGTYLMWLDFRYLGLEHQELVKLMIEKAGVGFSSGTDFGELGQGFMRMNIATPRSNVMKAMKQVAAAIKG